MWTRRQFVTIGAVAGLGAVTGCSRGGSTASPPRSVPSLDGRRADVTVRYTAGEMRWSIAGNDVTTWGYNELLPGPVLRATAGDLIEVTVDNQLPEATSIHWDWFHPHHGLQLERGLYAPLIIDDPDEHVMSDVEYVIVLDDWLDGTGTTPHDEFERIRAAGAEMGDMADMNHGSMEMATSPLLGGDAGDAIHPYHLLNGRPVEDPATLDPLPRAGDRVRLHCHNAYHLESGMATLLRYRDDD